MDIFCSIAVIVLVGIGISVAVMTIRDAMQDLRYKDEEDDS